MWRQWLALTTLPIVIVWGVNNFRCFNFLPGISIYYDHPKMILELSESCFSKLSNTNSFIKTFPPASIYYAPNPQLMIFQNFSNPSQILSPTPSITVRGVQRLIVWIYPYLWRGERLREHSCRGKWRCRIVRSRASPWIVSSDRFLCSESTKTDSSHRLSSTIVCSLFARPRTDGQRQPFWNESNFVKTKRTTRTCRFTNVIEVSGGNWDFLSQK